MSDGLGAIATTRIRASRILADAVRDISDRSEKEVAEKISKAVRSWDDVFDSGWYDPPPGGVLALFGTEPFDRLKYKSIRDPAFFPRHDIYFSPETVAQLHLCPVERKKGLFGDFGCTIYRGTSLEIKRHLKTVHDVIIGIAERAEVGMSFSQLFAYAQTRFTATRTIIGWMSTVHDTMQTNLGHTVPGSVDENVPTNSFDNAKEFIQTHRIFINEKQTFVIPPTCAFTVEARLTNQELKLPNTYFHVIVTFSGGRKEILTNFDDVFAAAGMTYMYE